MSIFFSNNPADWTDLEGVYVNELVPPAAILGINLNGVVVVGKTIRGPVNTPVQISSPQRLISVFGGRDLGSGGAIANDVWTSFLNKSFGSNTYVIRAAAAAAVAASGSTSDGYLDIDASSVGVWGNAVSFEVENATDGESDHFNLVITDYTGATLTYINLDITSGNDNTATVVGDDAANPVVLTKASSGRPPNQGPTLLTGGSDGSIADSDFTAQNGPLETAATMEGVGAVLIAQRSSAALKAKQDTLAGLSSDRMFLINTDTYTTSQASAITDVASYRSDRVAYGFNTPWTLDPTTAVQIQTQPADWLASILSQTDVSVNPASATDTKRLLQGITKLTSSLSRSDKIALKNAGIIALESNNGSFNFVSGVSTYLPDGTGKEQIDRRRETDYIQLSIANALEPFVKQKATDARRQLIVSSITAFCRAAQALGIIAEDSDQTGPGFLVDNKTLNTPESRGMGLENILLKVRLLNDLNYIVLTTSIGTQVTVSQS